MTLLAGAPALTTGAAPTIHDLRIRPYGTADAARLRRMSAALSRHSLFNRFFAGTPHLPEPYLRKLHALDHWDTEALVALLDDDIVGIAEYIRDRTAPHRAELAVLIADPWQRRGLGRMLVGLLARSAQWRGVAEFDASVLPANRGALAAIRNGWPQAKAGHADGITRFRLPLPVPGGRDAGSTMAG